MIKNKKIKESVGTDLIKVNLSRPVVVETDEVHMLNVGEQIIPRYLAIASLTQISND